MQKPLPLTLAGLAALWAIFPATNAFGEGLIGANVSIDYLYPKITHVYEHLGTGIVTSGGYSVEIFTNGEYTADGHSVSLYNIFGSQVTWTPAAFNGVELTVLSGGHPIIAVTVDPATTLTGFGPERVTFDATHLWLNMEGFVTQPGLDVKLDLHFAVAPVSGLCNSGQTAATASGCSGVLVPPNSNGGGPNVDGNWSLAYPYPLPLSGIKPPCSVSTYMAASVDMPNGSWLPNSISSTSEWITPFDGENQLPQGWYAFRTQFPVPPMLPNGKAPRGVAVDGQLASDNSTVWIYMESPAGSGQCELVSPGQPFPVNPANGPTFQQWWPFSFTNSVAITPGQDMYLYFVVVNSFDSSTGGPSPIGIRVEFFGTSAFY